MIREERDPAFWERIASHPVCAEALMGVEPRFFAEAAVAEPLLPLASEHGGLVFVPRDGFGRVLELHSLYTPEGWGREVLFASKAAFRLVFERADLVLTYERVGNWRTRPPRSFGFRPVGDEFVRDGVSWRLWQLSRDGWVSAPANRVH